MDQSITELINVLSTLATSGGFGVLAWWLITKSIPEREKRYDEQCEKREAAHREERDELIERIKDAHNTCERKIEALHLETLARLERMLGDKNGKD